MFRKSWLLLFCLLFLALSQNKAQQKTLNAGDSLFQWEAILDDDLSFNEIFFRNLQFPCVNKYILHDSKNPSVDYELKSQSSLKKSFSIKDGYLYLNGFLGADPFFHLPNHEIVYFTPVPLLNLNNIKRTRHNDTGEFICSYRSEELPEELKNFCSSNEITNLAINGKVEWDIDYESQQLLDNYAQDIKGYVINYNLTYRINSIQFKSNRWKEYDYDALDPLVKESFNAVTHTFQHFYEENEILPTATITQSPMRRFLYWDEEYLLPMAYCDNADMDINLYPNPTYGNINLQFRNAVQSNYTFTVFNIVGKELWSREINVDSRLYIDKFLLPNLTKGIYLYAIKDASGKTLTSRRLVVVEP